MRCKNKIVSILLIISLLSAIFPISVFAETNSIQVDKPVLDYTLGKKKEGKIICEVIEKREQNVKHFLKDDGTYEAAIYPVPVHYQENGQWKEIDNSLIDSRDEDNNDVVKNVQNDFKVKFGKNANSNKLVRIQKGKYEVSWNIAEAKNSFAQKAELNLDGLNNLSDDDKKMLVTKSKSGVNFTNVLPYTDLRYIVDGNLVKENIVLNSSAATNSVTFNLSEKQLIPVLQADKSVIFFDQNDLSKGIFKIPAPFMYDAKYEETKEIDVSLEKTNIGYKLSRQQIQNLYTEITTGSALK